MGVSLKSYDVSQHQRCFEGEAETAWELLTRHLKGGGKNAVEVYVFAESHCPSQGDWKRLRPLIARGCAAFSGRPCQAFEPPWFVFFRPLVPDPGIVIAHDALSSKLLIAVPRHKNDCKNLIDKLDDARANLERHAKTEGATANVILVRVPSDGSMTSCADWAKSYLEEHSTSPVSLIFLYQADVVRTDDGKGHYLCHHLMHVPGNAYGQWASQWPGVDLSLRLALPIGRVATQPSERWLLLPDGHRVSTENYYTFSRGYICADQTIGPDGKSCGELGEMSEGLFLCSVATVPGGRVVIQPKMATSHRLTII